jgi:hypothetical protein
MEIFCVACKYGYSVIHHALIYTPSLPSRYASQRQGRPAMLNHQASPNPQPLLQAAAAQGLSHVATLDGYELFQSEAWVQGRLETLRLHSEHLVIRTGEKGHCMRLDLQEPPHPLVSAPSRPPPPPPRPPPPEWRVPPPNPGVQELQALIRVGVAEIRIAQGGEEQPVGILADLQARPHAYLGPPFRKV